MSNAPTCQHCQHNNSGFISRYFGGSIWWTCDLRYTEPKYNPVDGKTSKGYFKDCSVNRSNEDVCGRNATQWKPRRKQDLFILLKRG